jgi:hypothetical protein
MAKLSEMPAQSLELLHKAEAAEAAAAIGGKKLSRMH